MTTTHTISKEDLQAKQDLYSNFPNITREDKKKVINNIIAESRSLPLEVAKNKRLIWDTELDLFLEKFGIELE